jgi:hypothetical protein
MSERDKQCRECEFFDKHGKCHRYPPQLFSVGAPPNRAFVEQLPNVKPDGYCGEFRHKGS